MQIMVRILNMAMNNCLICEVTETFIFKVAANSRIRPLEVYGIRSCNRHF
jgi:hypothetical protein